MLSGERTIAAMKVLYIVQWILKFMFMHFNELIIPIVAYYATHFRILVTYKIKNILVPKGVLIRGVSFCSSDCQPIPPIVIPSYLPCHLKVPEYNITIEPARIGSGGEEVMAVNHPFLLTKSSCSKFWKHARIVWGHFWGQSKHRLCLMHFLQ